MLPSPTEEILAIRRELSAKCGYDLHRIVEETRRRQRESGRTFLTLSPPLPHLPASPAAPASQESSP